MKKTSTIIRLIFGLALTAFGLMMLTAVMPDPHAAWEKQEGFSLEAKNFILDLWDSGYLMHGVAILHLLSGVLLLLNRFVPLALAIHLPVSLQMSLFHFFLDPKNGIVAFSVLILNGLLMYFYRDSYRQLFASKSDII